MICWVNLMIVAQFPPTLSTDYPNNINTNIRFEMNDVDIPSILISKDAKQWRVQIQDFAVSLFNFPTTH
jgi:hypothetical protein